MRHLATLGLCALLITACGKAATTTSSAPGDKYAGLETQFEGWRAEVQARHPACSPDAGVSGCQEFDIACKGERALTAEDTAKGVTAKVVAAMTFAGKLPDGASGKPGSAFAEFSRTGDIWTRAEAKPVNLVSCAEV